MSEQERGCPGLRDGNGAIGGHGPWGTEGASGARAGQVAPMSERADVAQGRVPMAVPRCEALDRLRRITERCYEFA
jgi:hypothetical protein